jgi:hypothetical protein
MTSQSQNTCVVIHTTYIYIYIYNSRDNKKWISTTKILVVKDYDYVEILPLPRLARDLDSPTVPLLILIFILNLMLMQTNYRHSTVPCAYAND